MAVAVAEKAQGSADPAAILLPERGVSLAREMTLAVGAERTMVQIRERGATVASIVVAKVVVEHGIADGIHQVAVDHQGLPAPVESHGVVGDIFVVVPKVIPARLETVVPSIIFHFADAPGLQIAGVAAARSDGHLLHWIYKIDRVPQSASIGEK